MSKNGGFDAFFGGLIVVFFILGLAGCFNSKPEQEEKDKSMGEFFKAFNSLQIVGIFAGFPFLISFVKDAAFAGAGPLFWILVIVYVIYFLLMTGSVFHSMSD